MFSAAALLAVLARTAPLAIRRRVPADRVLAVPGRVRAGHAAQAASSTSSRWRRPRTPRSCTARTGCWPCSACRPRCRARHRGAFATAQSGNYQLLTALLVFAAAAVVGNGGARWPAPGQRLAGPAAPRRGRAGGGHPAGHRAGARPDRPGAARRGHPQRQHDGGAGGRRPQGARQHHPTRPGRRCWRSRRAAGPRSSSCSICSACWPRRGGPDDGRRLRRSPGWTRSAR